ncbi:DNRLRE domain-containing protein [Mucilaginibacter sp. BT774]|uniref:DNRLRE domain-containing protein n=1 Tax=Mucilaginibacter sp. BT774 TaxID=3062276 RepID=UPI002675D52E|nr:DNRLRE domain-containing protein [Mucilaginibacter sp. BT774]MDO3625022.1 DNRLRE domain-containing protein [Mucilaginibacter sp. BT774]
MKTNLSLASIAFLCVFIISSCKKTNLDPVTPVTPVAEKIVAKAETDTTIKLPQDSLILTGKSGNPADTVVGYLWSQISGPTEASIKDESSSAAIARNLVAGKYIFQFMIIDKKGLTAVDSVSVTVMPAQITTLDLSPSNNSSEINLALLGTQDATNRASIEEPLAAWTINGVPFTTRNLLKFDLSSIPANATIVSADLYMYSDTIPKNGDLIHANFGADNSFIVQQVATQWDPSTVDWFNQPAGLTDNQVIAPTTPLPFLNMDINVKAIVSSMVSNNSNYGFKLQLQNEVEYTSRIFCSSNYVDVSRHPRLVVKYIKN